MVIFLFEYYIALHSAQDSNGWSLRVNGSCLDDEVSCGDTGFPFYACCPATPTSTPQNHGICCPSSKRLSTDLLHLEANETLNSIATDCTGALIKSGSRYAAPSWSYCHDDAGSFCCLQGYTCYHANSTNSVGCGGPGYVLQAEEYQLFTISQAPRSAAVSSILAVENAATTAASSTSPLFKTSTTLTLPTTTIQFSK